MKYQVECRNLLCAMKLHGHMGRYMKPWRGYRIGYGRTAKQQQEVVAVKPCPRCGDKVYARGVQFI